MTAQRAGPIPESDYSAKRRLPVSESSERLVAANRALECFAPDSKIERRRGGWYVVWENYQNEKISRRWQTKGQDWFPTWNRIWAHGGTACRALSQLIRWLRDQPVLCIASWRYWGGESCKLFRNGKDPVPILLDAGYPEHAYCVLCGRRLDGPIDWWNLNGVSGPCCCYSWEDGCRQKQR